MVSTDDPASAARSHERSPRDPKKSFLLIGLAALSWVATYVGMLELIEANMGELPIIHRIIIGFSVAMLMTMVVWLLDQMFQPHHGAMMRLIYFSGYLFLTIISVGFGFGFYWKVLESRSEASRSAESAVGSVQSALYAASTRLEQLDATLGQLSEVSTQKAELERNAGTSCPNSRPGDGPRRKLREDDAQRLQFAHEFVKGRVKDVKSSMTALDTDLALISKNDASIIDPKSGTRNEFMTGLGRRLDLTVTGFNAFRTDPQLRQLRTDLADRAEKVTFPDTKGGSFACPDPQLQTALRGVVRAIDQLPELEKPKISAVEGSEATIEAFRRLTASFMGLLTFKMPPSADELRALQQRAVQSVEGPASAAMKASQEVQPGLSRRDYVPLAIAIFVDLCLLLVSIGRGTHRLQRLVPTMRNAEKFQVEEWLKPFGIGIELLREVVFDYHGAYYVAVPLDAPRNIPDPKRREFVAREAKQLDSAVTSVEQLNLFKRVLWPDFGPPISWLVWTNVAAARKRLRNQGSRFADAPGFRFYRFTKGMWPDMVLGAVRGFAQREAMTARAAAAEAKIAPRVRQEGPAIERPSRERSDWADVQPEKVAAQGGVRARAAGGERPFRRPIEPMADWKTRRTISSRPTLRVEPDDVRPSRSRDDGLDVRPSRPRPMSVAPSADEGDLRRPVEERPRAASFEAGGHADNVVALRPMPPPLPQDPATAPVESAPSTEVVIIPEVVERSEVALSPSPADELPAVEKDRDPPTVEWNLRDDATAKRFAPDVPRD